jgi:hypothetical protein
MSATGRACCCSGGVGCGRAGPADRLQEDLGIDGLEQVATAPSRIAIAAAPPFEIVALHPWNLTGLPIVLCIAPGSTRPLRMTAFWLK